MYDKNERSGSALPWIILILVVVIIAAALIIPKCFNLRAEAQISATAAFAASLAAANASNYAMRKSTPTLGIPILNCTDVAQALHGADMPTGYSIVPQAIREGEDVTCLLKGPTDSVEVFTATGIN